MRHLLPPDNVAVNASRLSKICMLRSLGAPVMEPPGKAARRQSTIEASGRREPRTVLTRWCMLAKVSTSISAGTCTLPTCSDCTSYHLSDPGDQFYLVQPLNISGSTNMFALRCMPAG